MSKHLIDILCCPVTHKNLKRPASRDLAALNRAIERGEITRQDGQVVSAPVNDALITEDARILYRIDDGIPVLLEEESIILAQLDT